MNMIEKIARAIAASDYDRDDLWEDLSQVIRDSYLHNSRDVLDAMLEPTDGMLDAGELVDSESGATGNQFTVYRTMIQAAKDGA